MKKYLSLLLICCTLFSLVACSSTPKAPVSKDPTAVASPLPHSQDGSQEGPEGEEGEEEMGPEEKAMIEQVQKSITENSKKLPSDIAALATVDGNLEGQVVVVNTQGGPMYELDTITVRTMLQEALGQTDAIIANVHQIQTLNPQKFMDKDITFDQAIAYDSKSVEDLAKVVKYFKSEGKTVYVFGMSFGAWMVQDLIVNEGTEVADRFFIANGRLDMPEAIWTSFSKGGSGYFENGVTPISNLEGTMENPESKQNSLSPGEKNIGKLAAGLGHKRYSDLLKGKDLSNVFYLYGKTDQAVGSLSDEEVELLKQLGATVSTYDGGHSAPNDKMKEGFNFLGLKGQ